MVSEQAERADDMAAMLSSMADKYRDPNIEPGTLLGESDVGGQQVRWTKQRSMVRMGKTPLPERFEAWDIYGKMSMLPTAQMNYQLAKPNAEFMDRRAFHVHVGGVTRTNCKICPPTKEPYPGSCEWCLESSFGKVVKKFADQNEQETHFYLYHERQWATLQSQLARKERAEETAANRELAQAVLAAVQPRPLAEASARETEARRAPEPADAAACDQCDYVGDTPHALSIHKGRAHKGGE